MKLFYFHKKIFDDIFRRVAIASNCDFEVNTFDHKDDVQPEIKTKWD
mgnify:CR=1 FL=1